MGGEDVAERKFGARRGRLWRGCIVNNMKRKADDAGSDGKGKGKGKGKGRWKMDRSGVKGHT